MSTLELVYPVWVYHEVKCPDGVIARSAEQMSKLEEEYGKGWVDTPLKYKVQPAPKPPPEKVNQAMADELVVEVQKIEEPLIEEKPKDTKSKKEKKS
jgi:hypothetical protein